MLKLMGLSKKPKIKLFIIISLLVMVIASLFLLLKSKKQPSATPLPSYVCKDCNIIVITMTNLRWDHMSSNGYFRPTTTNLDNLAKDALVFDNAFAHSSWTLPESITLYTSLYPSQHGIMNRYDGSSLSPNIQTLIDILNNNGYKTAAFTGGFDYNSEFGLTGRFKEYGECTKGKSPSYPRQGGPRTSRESIYGELSCTIPKALEWLQKNSSKKFFLQVQGFDAHCPFSQKGGYTYDKGYKGNINFSECLWTLDKTEPTFIGGKPFYSVYSSKTGVGGNTVLLGEEDIKHLIALYDEGITFADKEIGRLLEEIKRLGLSEKTIIVFTSEHGDMFGKQGRFMRGGPLRGTFYDDVLHVPLVLKHPKIQPKRIAGLVGQIDLAPTLLDLLNLPPLSGAEGKSLTPLIFKGQEVNKFIFAGAEFGPNSFNPYFNKRTRVEVIRNKEWKLIQETLPDENSSLLKLELYNIAKDKEELKNLAETNKDTLQELQLILADWSKRTQKAQN